MNGPSAVVSANILPASFKMKNGNPVSMGKIRPNNSTYYGSVAASNLNTINSLQASTDNYRLMTPTIPSRESNSNRANQSSSYVNSSTEKDDLAPSRQNFAKTTSSMFADIHSNRPSSSSTGKNNLNSTFPAMGTANNSSSNNNTANSSNSAGNTSLFSSSQPISSTSNFYTNGSGGGSSNGFVNKFNGSVSGSNNSSGGGSQYNNYPYPTSSNSSGAGFNPKSTFVRSLTAPSPVLALNHNSNSNTNNNNNNQSDFRTASSSSSANHQVNMNHIIGMDGRKEWNIRDSMTIPPIRHNPSNDYSNNAGGGAFSNLFGEGFLNTENSDSSEANTNLGSLSKSMKSLKRVRFSDPICLYEPMTNTLRNRIIHESQKLVEMNGNINNNGGLKSVLKVGGGGGRNGEFSEPSSSFSSHQQQLQQQMQLNVAAMNPNPNLITINTATNTMSNKTVANTALSKIMNTSAVANRPISAPINGLKRIMETQQQQVAAQQPAPNPLLSSRDQIVKKSLIELQTKIVSNLASISGENNNNNNSGGTSESKQQTQEQIIKEREDNKLFQTTSMAGLQNQINENNSSKNNSNITNNNTVNTNNTNSPNNRLVDDSRRPKSASYSSHQQQTSNSSMEAMKAFVPSVSAALFSASNNTHTHQNNSSHSDNNNNSSSNNNNNQQLVPVNRGPALFNLMAKSILIGNYSCRVVNNIQFFADHFEFLFPIYDFSQSNGLPFSSNNAGITGAGGNYSSLKGLCIYYKDVSNITLLSNKMRCRLAPNWFSSDSNNNNSDNANNNNNNNTSSLAAIHGYLCIEFSSLSYMIILREKIIPVMSNFTK
jgi:DNA-binding protein H-NS